MKNCHDAIRRWLPCALLLALFACGGGGGGDDDSDIEGNAITTPNRTVPENVLTASLISAQDGQSSDARGVGVVMFDPASRQMRATVTTAGISGLSAHIHVAPSAADSTIVFSLAETPAGSGIWSLQTAVTDEQLAALRGGDYFFSVRSAASAQPDISGRILRRLPALPPEGFFDTDGSGGNLNIDGAGGANVGPVSGSSVTGTPVDAVDPNANDPTLTGGTAVDAIEPSSGTASRRAAFVNILTGKQQVPASGSNAVAVSVAIVDVDSRTMIASITSIDIAGTSAHIHQAAAGASGSAVFALSETGLSSGIWTTRLALSEAQFTVLANGNYYFDIHTAGFPNGEVRAQIAAGRTSGQPDTGSVITDSNDDDFGTGTAPGGIGSSPLIPGSITGSGSTGGVGTSPAPAGAPTFGNPVGSGIGSGSSIGSSGSVVPTFGNPVGSGIGIGAANSTVSDGPGDAAM